MRSKIELLEQALEGHLRREHEFLLRRMLMQTRFLENQAQALRRAMIHHLNPQERQAVALWDTIPGVNEAVAWTLVAETGVCTDQFPDAHHLASWIAFCPGNHESGGKRRWGKTRKANPWLRSALCEAAWAASHTKGTYLAAFYRRIAARKGRKRAIVATAHALAIIAYQMLKNNEPYRDLGESHFDRIRPEKTADRLVRGLQKLGYEVSIQKSIAQNG